MQKPTGKRRKKASINRRETFDAFLERDGLLAETEDAAIKEIIADPSKWPASTKCPPMPGPTSKSMSYGIAGISFMVRRTSLPV